MSKNAPTPESATAEKPWPSCGNCGRPAYVYLGGYPVCIDCNYKHKMGQWMDFAQNAAMMNHASQEIDAIVGLGVSPTIQIPRPPVPPINYNNQAVTVSGGTVGAINFGSVRDIQVSLQELVQSGSPDIADPLARLTDAILNAQDADEPSKNDLLEQVASLTALASAKPEERKPGIVKALFSAVKGGSEAISSTAAAWAAAEPLLKGHFGF